MSRKIELDFEVIKDKITIKVLLRQHSSKQYVQYDAIIDTGCNRTTISKTLFSDLGYEYKETQPVKILGINGESRGTSTIIDNFMLGGTDLGKMRITVADIHPQFTRKIILGMNILKWFSFMVDFGAKKVVLFDRRGEGEGHFTKTRGANTNLMATQEIDFSSMFIEMEKNHGH
ncbi:MAG: retroviral-like aspartic protease family protein [Defluviitaleaceae bacterium]|nr:retroviral-like aspartic protease family protein [Defluviitaleaceae bacterium]